MKKRILSNASIGKYIREKRIELNYTQEDLASMMGITKTAVSNWENGNTIVDIKYLVLLSNIFSVSVDDILFPDVSGYGKSTYSDISRQFQEMVAYKTSDSIQHKKILDLFVDTKNRIVALIKKYSKSHEVSVIDEIITSNVFGFSLDGWELVDEKQVTSFLTSGKEIEDELETLWHPLVVADKAYEQEGVCQKLPHIFPKKADFKYFLDGDDGAYGLILTSNSAMLEFIYTFGGERIFRKFVQSFSKEYQNQILYNLVYFSKVIKKQKHFDKDIQRAIKWLLRAGAEFYINSENCTKELALAVI